MNAQWIRAGATGSFIAAALLVVQFVIGSTLGSDLVLLETSFDAARVNAFLQAHAATMINLMIVDDLFVVAYTVGFIGLAVYAMARSRVVAFVALGLALLTSATDFTENSLTIALVRLAIQVSALQVDWLLALQILGQLKYLWIYVGVALFAVAIWDVRRETRIVAILFWLFPVLGGLAPASVTFGLVRVLWMFVLLMAGGIFLWRESGQRIRNG